MTLQAAATSWPCHEHRRAFRTESAYQAHLRNSHDTSAAHEPERAKATPPPASPRNRKPLSPPLRALLDSLIRRRMRLAAEVQRLRDRMVEVGAQIEALEEIER